MYVWTYVWMYAMYMGALPEPVSKILLQARRGCWIQQKRSYSCEPPSACWELNHGFLDEQPVLLTAVPFLPSPIRWSLKPRHQCLYSLYY